ncbi:cytochrome P450 [Nocardia nova]|uniref:cytochrome P450 n=1 Tax=Nocardia nova TaxID=37330 RepID=UPI0033FA7313
MSTPAPLPDTGTCPAVGPEHTVTEQMARLYGPEFFADPHRAWQQLHRDRRRVVPVAVAPGQTATAVLGYERACQILADSEHYPTQSVAGQAHGERQDRVDLAQAAGADHARLRSAVRECLERIDQHALHATVGDLTAMLIASFSRKGSADLVGDFASPLVVQTFSWLLGLPAEMWDRAAAGAAALRAEGDAAVLTEVAWVAVEAARGTSGADVISWLCGHRVGLDDYEVVQQVLLLYRSGCLPTIDLIANTLLLAVTDQQFGDAVMFGALSLRDALEYVLAVEPPRPVLRPRFPPNLQIVDGVHLPAHQPVLVSPAACAADPVMDTSPAGRVGNRSHLGWGGGPHKCPDAAASVAMLVAEHALNLLFESLPDIRHESATPIEWLPNLYHRALLALPVTFEPASPLAPLSA